MFLIACAFLFTIELRAAWSLKCYDGFTTGDVVLSNFTAKECTVHEVWCFSLHAADGRNGGIHVDVKSCWNPDWESGRYKDEGCIKGQHCVGGKCYDNATACLCKTDLCNGWTENGNITTPIPAEPTPPPGGWHQCYYGAKEGNVANILQTQSCMSGEELCVYAYNEEKKYEYRSCWDARYNLEFSRPGCYKNFEHCHRDHCYNDTTICVCSENLCNSDTYSSEAPPVTPGSGLYCYGGDWEEEDYKPRECRQGENFCIEFLSKESKKGYRDCWNPDYDPKYNFTGCEFTQTCFRGSCYNSTVCICEDDLCNSFGIDDGQNGTTSQPTQVTTTNMTMLCWYGRYHNRSDHNSSEWQPQICGPQEDLCLLLTDGDFQMGQCYDSKYNGGKYDQGCYHTGQHCWDNQCHNGTICLCDSHLCNNPDWTTPEPHSTTPGSGLECYYGFEDEDHKVNLTTQICNRNETLCLAVYGEHDDDAVFMASCWDPRKEEGRYNDTNLCTSGLHCWHHDDGTQSCHNGTVCTCNDDLCNGRNASSGLSTPSTSSMSPAANMVCWFGEKHSHTGPEEWVPEECLTTEHYCFQMIYGRGEDRFESRQCWNLSYQDHAYNGVGCYSGEYCHYDHCFDNATVCICDTKECNGWTPGGNVTTEVPVTGGSGLLCYSGDADHYEDKECKMSETMCLYFNSVDGVQHLDCYNPSSNEGQYTSPDCWDAASIGQFEDKTGRLCLCDANDFCNKDFLKDPDNGNAGLRPAVFFTLSLAAVVKLIVN